jgi:hypothetical protein
MKITYKNAVKQTKKF